MNKTQRYLILCLGIAQLIFTSCGKKDPVGPSINGIYGPLTIVNTLDKSADNIQFANNETVYFIASFADDASWVLTLKGRTSGAVKTFTGVSKNLDAYNTLWNGTANTVPSFRAEIVDAELTFPNSVNDTLRTSLTITSKRNADADAVLITNFNVSKVSGAGSTTGWPSDWPSSVVTNTLYPYPDGTRYMYMTGYPWQGGNPANSPYVDFMTIPANYADTPYGTYYPLYSDASRVYFNLMMYNVPNSNTWLKIVFFEDGVAARTIDIKNPDWTGWKLLSYNYLNTLPANTSVTTARPNKITGVQFVLLSSKTGSSWPTTDVVYTAFDHPVFTHDIPYQP